MSHHEKKGAPEGIGKTLRRATEDEDTEGHKAGLLRRATEDEDTEGHKAGLLRRATEDEDDVEGHRVFRT
jgi:hypothetical protein